MSVPDPDAEEDNNTASHSLVHHIHRPKQDNGASGINILLFASQLSSQLPFVNNGDVSSSLSSSRLPTAVTTAAVCTEPPLKSKSTVTCSLCGVSSNGTADTRTTTTSMYQKMMTDRLTSMNTANEASEQSSNLLLSSANSMFINSVLEASKKSKSTPRHNHQKDQIKIGHLEQHIRKKLMEKIQRNQLIHKNRLLMNQQQADDIQKYHQKYGQLYRRALLEQQQHQLKGRRFKLYQQILRQQLNK